MTVGVQEGPGVVEQVNHGSTAMVASHVGVEVLPDALDAIGVWAIGRKEVEHHSMTKSYEGLGRLRAGVDDVVVHYEVELGGVRIVTTELFQQRAE